MYIVHCTSGGSSKLGGKAQPVGDYDTAQRLKAEWEDQGAVVEVRTVDNSRDWNDTSDPVVREAERAERAEMERDVDGWE